MTDPRQLEMDLHATRLGLQRMREERDQWRAAYLRLSDRVERLVAVWTLEDDLLHRRMETQHDPS